MFFESFLLNLLVILVLIVALIFDYVTKFFSFWYVRHINYKYPVPFFGSDYHRVLGLRGTTDEVTKLCQKYEKDKFVGCIRSRIPDLIVKDPENVKLMLSEKSDHFNSRGLCLERSRDVCLRNNLFYAESEKWRLLRGNLESILRNTAGDFERSKRSVDKYLPEVNGEINVRNFLEDIMDGVIKDLLFGERLNSAGSTSVASLRAVLRTRTISQRLKSYLKNIFPSVYVLLGLNTINTYPYKEINKALENSTLLQQTMKCSFEPSKAKKTETYSESDTAFSILSSILTEGYTPCLNTIICLLYELTKDHSTQQKVRACARNPVNDDYLDAAIKETMRLYPSYTMITRKCTKTFKFPETDLLIDRGITITVPIEIIHQNKSYYERPEAFDPSRFLDSGNEKRPEYAFMPYGIGIRRCLGKLNS